ncbi:MAG: proline dehydrogenase family protein, partial [Bdellovibrionales bacterium]|nr:proline dehydrogenase family protein [Bdellovibrionales bacterium]
MDVLSKSRGEAFEAAIRERGLAIFSALENEGASIFNKDWWYGRIMDWSMKNEHFKTQMFRFVDVLPYLNSSGEVAKHLKEYFLESGDQLPSVFNFGVGMGSLAPGLMAGAVKKNIQQMARMFITGQDPQEALPVLKKSRKVPMGFTVDLLGEATLSEIEAKDYFDRYETLIKDLAKDATTWEEIPQIDRDENGPIPKVNISVKLTSLYSQIRETAWEASKEKLKERVRPLLRTAVASNVFINIDMEQYEHKDLTLEVFKEILIEEEFKSYPFFGIVIQAYLRDSLQDCKNLVTFAKSRGVPFTIRLVKGAYWDFEVIHAQQLGWPIPVFTQKRESDLNYELCAEELISAYPQLHLAIGSHNIRSIAACLILAEQKGLPKEAIEIQMLFGMAEPIKRSLVKMGYRMREYATVGE